MRVPLLTCLLLFCGQAPGDTFLCQRINAGAAPDFVVGRFIKGGARGKVHEITGAGIPANSVVKIYDPEHEPAFSAEKVEGMAERYHAIHKLFPNNAMPVHGVKETSPGRYGVVMGQIPDKIRTYDPKYANEKTIKDLEHIRDTLIKNELDIVDFSFTIREDGSVILYDLDYVRSWNRSSPFFHADTKPEEGPGKVRKRIDFWIETAREDIRDAWKYR